MSHDDKQPTTVHLAAYTKTVIFSQFKYNNNYTTNILFSLCTIRKIIYYKLMSVSLCKMAKNKPLSTKTRNVDIHKLILPCTGTGGCHGLSGGCIKSFFPSWPDAVLVKEMRRFCVDTIENVLLR